MRVEALVSSSEVERSDSAIIVTPGRAARPSKKECALTCAIENALVRERPVVNVKKKQSCTVEVREHEGPIKVRGRLRSQADNDSRLLAWERRSARRATSGMWVREGKKAAQWSAGNMGDRCGIQVLRGRTSLRPIRAASLEM